MSYKIKDLILFLCSVFFVLIVTETILHFTRFRHIIPADHDESLDGYYESVDSELDFDIKKNIPPRMFYFGETGHLIWSNELGCFDKCFTGKKEYILLVGDSFTWGFSPYEKKFGTIVENILGFRVLKCGVPAYGTKEELLKSKKIIEKLGKPPKMIILEYFLGNDFSDDYSFPSKIVIDGYLLTKRGVMSNGDIKIFPDEVLKEKLEKYKAGKDCYNYDGASSIPLPEVRAYLRKNSILYLMLSNVIVKLFNVASSFPTYSALLFSKIEQSPKIKEAWDEHLNNLREIKELSVKSNAKLIIVLVPPKNEVYDLGDSLYWHKQMEAFKKTLVDFLKLSNIDYLDLTPTFYEYVNHKNKTYLGFPKDLHWQFDGHWNIRGNKLAGLLISKYIIENNMIDVKKAKEKKRYIEQELRNM